MDVQQRRILPDIPRWVATGRSSERIQTFAVVETFVETYPQIFTFLSRFLRLKECEERTYKLISERTGGKKQNKKRFEQLTRTEHDKYPQLTIAY